MPRKKTTVIEEDVNDKEEIKHEDIHDKSFEEIAAEKPEKDEKVSKEAEKPVEKEEEVEFDPNKFKEEVAKEVTEGTTKKIVEALTGEKETQEQKDKYVAYSEKFQKEHGRNPTWFEVSAFIKEDLKADMKREEEEKAKQTEEQEKANQKNEEQRLKSFNAYVDSQLNDLYANKKLIPIPEGNKDENHPGVLQRKALFKTMLDVNTERVKNKLEPIYSIKEIYYEHYQDPTKQPAGSDAPVSLGRSGSSHDDKGGDYTYEEIHKKNIFDFFRK